MLNYFSINQVPYQTLDMTFDCQTNKLDQIREDKYHVDRAEL